ncbi:MAG: hypothetical protein JRD89_07280 [Deltaproteobacteria bacterium]|nr:hypothetical protein [Deltaproteobacteria bacterium]
MPAIINRARLYLGIEVLRCPRCKAAVSVPVHTDLPERVYLSCAGCNYRAMLNTAPILDKYGIPAGLSRAERRQTARHLQDNITKI